MNKDALSTEENVIISPDQKREKSSYTINTKSISNGHHSSYEQFVEQKEHTISIDESKDFDTDSGVSSVRQSSGKGVISLSRTTIAMDEELENTEHLSLQSSTHEETDDYYRRQSQSSSLNSVTHPMESDELHVNSLASSRASSMYLPPFMPATSTINKKSSSTAQVPVNTNVSEPKEKSGVRKFIKKLFKSSSSNASKSSTNAQTPNVNQPKTPVLHIDTERGTAYPPLSPLPVTQGPIRLLVLRHGERLDRYYSSQWLRQAFDKSGNFCRFSPILPETLPFRSSIRDFDLDPPLTYKGLKDAYHTGTVLREKSITINYCYSSPALRCVQTAAKLLEGLQLQNKIKIRIEPGLFECTGWYTASEASTVLIMPRFMTKKEFLENKYSIDKQYHEQMTLTELSQLENELEFYQRSHAVTANILKMHEHEFVTQIQQGQATSQQHMHILFVAHAPSLETCTRKLCGGKFRPDTLPHVIRNVDFLTMTVIEKTNNNADKWIFRRNSFYGDEF